MWPWRHCRHVPTTSARCWGRPRRLESVVRDEQSAGAEVVAQVEVRVDQRVRSVGHVQSAVALDSESEAREVQYRARAGEVDRVGLIDVISVVDCELTAVLDGNGDAGGEVERSRSIW